MQAVILSGGIGKRLKPITDYVPKPLVPLKNVPILEWQIRYLKKNGVKNVIICSGYKNDQIENFLKTKNNLGISIKFSIEKSPLGTGGAIKKAARFIKDRSFFVINGDTITNIPLKRLKTKLNAVAAIELKTKYGILHTNKDKVTGFSEKKEIKDVWMNAGIYHLSRNIIKDLPKKGNIERRTFPKYAKQKKLNIVKFRNIKWHSIDSHKDLDECEKVVTKIIK